MHTQFLKRPLPRVTLHFASEKRKNTKSITPLSLEKSTTETTTALTTLENTFKIISDKLQLLQLTGNLLSETTRVQALKEASEALSIGQSSLKQLTFRVSELEAAVIHDKRTSLYNVRHFEHMKTKLYEEAARSGHPLTAIAFDLDNFKDINDRDGHAAGDVILQFVGRLVQRLCRASDSPFRVGGEEFVILLPSTPLSGGIEMAERLAKSLIVMTQKYRQKPRSQTNSEYRLLQQVACRRDISASIGVACFDPNTTTAPSTADALIQHADEAAYTAKRNGKNRIYVYHPEKQENVFQAEGPPTYDRAFSTLLATQTGGPSVNTTLSGILSNLGSLIKKQSD